MAWVALGAAEALALAAAVAEAVAQVVTADDGRARRPPETLGLRARLRERLRVRCRARCRATATGSQQDRLRRALSGAAAFT